MKKLLLLLLLTSTIIVGCSKDSEVPTDETKSISQESYMKVLGISHGPSAGVEVYNVIYGTSDKDQIMITVSKDVWYFYLDRLNKGINRWIGEVTKE
jgi:uncharacterized protein YcfL